MEWTLDRDIVFCCLPSLLHSLALAALSCHETYSTEVNVNGQDKREDSSRFFFLLGNLFLVLTTAFPLSSLFVL